MHTKAARPEHHRLDARIVRIDQVLTALHAQREAQSEHGWVPRALDAAIAEFGALRQSDRRRADAVQHHLAPRRAPVAPA